MRNGVALRIGLTREFCLVELSHTLITLDCEKSLFSSTTVGKNTKQVSVRACSRACFAFYPTVFEEKRDCSQYTISASTISRDLFRPVMDI